MKLSGSAHTDVIQASETKTKVAISTKTNSITPTLSIRERMLQMKRLKQEKVSNSDAVFVMAPPSLR